MERIVSRHRGTVRDDLTMTIVQTVREMEETVQTDLIITTEKNGMRTAERADSAAMRIVRAAKEAVITVRAVKEEMRTAEKADSAAARIVRVDSTKRRAVNLICRSWNS